MSNSSPSLPSFPPQIASAPPAPPGGVIPPTLSLPVVVLLTLLGAAVSGGFSAGGAYFALSGTVAQTSALVTKLAVDFDARQKESAERRLATQIKLSDHERRLGVLEGGAGEASKIHEDLRLMSSKIDALCRANRAANCGP